MSERTPPALARLSRAALSPADPEAPDALLLGRFVTSHDEDAFARLVVRHGPMVLAVCRRVAGDGHLALDAFQAAFLVLARRAAAVHPREALRGWLYGVAVRTARAARVRIARRREVLVPSLPDCPAPATPPTDPDALAALDEEIARLPERLRSAVLLCELDGLGRKDAAARLRIPEGTLSSRLATARRVLAARLRNRGIVPAAGLGVLLGSAPVPGALSDAAVRLASSRTVPASVAQLSREVFRTMLLTKLKTVAIGGVLLAVGLAVLALTLSSLPAAVGESPTRAEANPTGRPAPAPDTWPPGGLLLVTAFNLERPVELFKPDGTAVRKPAVRDVFPLHGPRLSPDGKRWLALTFAAAPERPGPWIRYDLYVFDTDAKDRPGDALLRDLPNATAVWSHDGTKIYGSQIDPEKEREPRQPDKQAPLVNWVYDLAARKKTPLAVPAGHEIIDLSPDGNLLTRTDGAGGAMPFRAHLVPLDTLRPRPLTDKPLYALRFSPDGKWVFGNRLEVRNRPEFEVKVRLVAVSVADGAERVVALPEEVMWVRDLCGSPDGKRIVYHWEEEPPKGAPRPGLSRVNVADADGSNATTIIRWDHRRPVNGLDWR
jgi:RNA polymerase sigma factor (sigma-70 family)